MGALFLEGLFKKLTNTIDNECFIDRNRRFSTAFTRDRKLNFKNLLLALMSFTRPGIQTELDRFFRTISTTPNSFVSISKSAFSQARKNLKSNAFIELRKIQIQYFKTKAPTQKSWKEKRVIGIDGTLINLPTSNQLKDRFGYIQTQHDKIISARCSFAFDVCNELIIDAQIDKRKSCEKELACLHLSSLNPKSDILVFDRGYPAQWLVGILMQLGYKFCFRLSTAWKGAYQELNEKGNDVDWEMYSRSNKAYKLLREYNVPEKLKGLRLISIRLPSGENEVLLTNLTDRNKFSTKDMKQLYQMRWGVEEAFKSLKKVLYIENFTGKSELAIIQDLNAKVLMLNLASIIRSQTKSNVKSKGRKGYQINKCQSIAKTKDFLVDLFLKPGLLNTIYFLMSLLTTRMEMIRPDRSIPRKDTSAKRRLKGLNSKGI